MAELFLLVDINKVKYFGEHQVYPRNDKREIIDILRANRDPSSFLVLETNSDFEYLFFDGAKWLAENEQRR